MKQLLFLPMFMVCCLLLSACTLNGAESVFVGVMIDNHENARAYQRGLEEAILIQEQFVEGFITRFEAVFAIDHLPDSVGPIRSVRPYFIDGVSPIISAIFHVGGSPEALEKTHQSETVTSFDALWGFDRFFTYDADAPAPHNRFMTSENLTTLIKNTEPVAVPLPLFPLGGFSPDEPATEITIDYRSPLHNLLYSYDSQSHSYARTNRGMQQPPSPTSLLILETSVAVTGELGRLSVDLHGTGNVLLFRDGGLVHGTWNKANEETFFGFNDAEGNTMRFAKGQVWMIVLDSLERIRWK